MRAFALSRLTAGLCADLEIIVVIEIDGQKYKVTENLGYSHDMGCYAKAVMTEQGERIAVKVGNAWKFRSAGSGIIAAIRPPAKVGA